MYYTPEIEEFYVGFEYERFVPKSNTTEEECWDKLLVSVNYLSLDDEILEKKIRVKYLDKSDIESYGFKYLGLKFLSNDVENFRLDVTDNIYYKVQYHPSSNLLGLYYEEDNGDGECLFYGKIKNKSEFKNILEKTL